HRHLLSFPTRRSSDLASTQRDALQRCKGTVAISGRGKEANKLVWQWMVRANRQRGQGMVEYALILVLVSIVVIVILLTMGNQIQDRKSTRLNSSHDQI